MMQVTHLAPQCWRFCT